MRRTFLAGYILTCTNSESGDPVNVTRLEGPTASPVDLFQLFQDYLNYRKAERLDGADAQQTLIVDAINPEHGRCVYGSVMYGIYGVNTNLVNRQTNEIAHRRSREESDEWPYYYQMYSPADKHRAVLVLQRTGNIGIRTALWDDFIAFILGKIVNTKIEISPTALREMLPDFLDRGRVTEVRFIKESTVAAPAESQLEQSHDALSQQVASQNGTPTNRRGPREYSAEIVHSISPKGGWFYRMTTAIKSWIETADSAPQGLVSFIGGESYDRAEVEVELGGRKKLIRVGRPNESRAWEDITESVAFGDDGHPVLTSIHALASNYASQMATRL